MIWLTWRQFRVQALTAAAALAAFAILLAITGPHLASLYSTSKVPGCHGFACSNAADAFLDKLAGLDTFVYLLGIGLVLVAPAIIGIFWGAPLIAREVETRTFNLAWTQGTTRTQWLATKVALTGLAAMAVTEALSLIYSWWASPIINSTGLSSSGPQLFSQGKFSSVIFATHGIVPLGYAAFAFTLGTAAGALIRRTVPAMAVTLAIFAAVQVVMPLAVRPHLAPASHTTFGIQAADQVYGSLTADVVPGQPDAWILSSQALNAAGQPVSAIPAGCFSPPAGPGAKGGTSSITPGQCMQNRGYREAISYVPTSRYWLLQWTETGIFLILALALAWFSFWRLSRRRT
ncbi:MAG TPA: ABC transporter permease subunit [Streptosporangiaceae bacterium]|nr:ABC transporter permease subunit [Streptosporangiaceae bacterium]